MKPILYVAVAVALPSLLATACGSSDPPPPKSVPTPAVAPQPAPVSAAPMTSTAPSAVGTSPPAGTSTRSLTGSTSTTTTSAMPLGGPCDNCVGTVTPDLQAALTKRAQESRSCYVTVLNTNPRATASMNVEITVGRDGTACSASAYVDAPEPPGLADCVSKEFKKGGFVTPGGASCVLTRVPIQFTPAR